MIEEIMRSVGEQILMAMHDELCETLEIEVEYSPIQLDMANRAIYKMKHNISHVINMMDNYVWRGRGLPDYQEEKDKVKDGD